MGVIQQPRKVLIQTGDSNSEMSSAHHTDDESGRSTPAVPAVPKVPSLCSTLVSRNISYRLKMKKGRRSKQRFDNERLLVAMYGVDAECEAGMDLVRESNSYFTDLMDEENKILYEEFLNNEESKYFNIPEEEEGEGDLEPLDLDQLEQKFQAEDAFMRIGSRMRQALKKKNLPIGMLQGIEETINGNFSQDPKGEFVCEMSSFERLLVHALCAYYSLNSYSFDRDGKRILKVENPRNTFFKKDPSLTEYLVTRMGL